MTLSRALGIAVLFMLAGAIGAAIGAVLVIGLLA
jgi:hypothetical protein